VYWRRRLFLLGGALVLVLGLARVLGAGSDGSSDDDGRASLADAPVSTSSSSPTPAGSPTATGTKKPGKGSKGSKRNNGNKGATAPVVSETPVAPETPMAPTSTAPVLAEPDGPCVDSDVAVTPEVAEAIAGPRYGVAITLQLRTITAEACTWKVSPTTLSVKINSGQDDIWSSRECPKAVPAQEVTVRQAVSTTVTLAWDAKRSDEDCSRLTEYAMPGWYHVSAAALGGEPSEVQFELVAPTPVVVTQTAEPQPDGKGKGGKDKGGKNGGQASSPGR
jgi:hypothetical protein